MKKSHIIHSCILMSALLLPASCSIDIDEYKEASPDGGNTLTLTASASDIVLKEQDWTSDGLTLSWSTGSNFGTGNALEYKIEIAQADGEYTDGYVQEMGRRVYELSYTVQNLNNFVKENFGAESGTAATYKARVTATVTGREDLTQTSEVQFNITPYEPVTTTLYMIGEATAGGWSVDNPTEMTRESPGIFSWRGVLKEGDLRFITTSGKFWPGYVRDGEASDGMTLKYFAEQPEDAQDLKFNISEGRGYSITADLLNLTLSIEEADINEPPYSMIYFVSEANNWSFEEMTQDPINHFIFRYGAEIGNGQFKFGTAPGSWENMYKAMEDNAQITNTQVQFVSGTDPDYKWLLYDEANPGKPYKIALDITSGSESMKMSEFTPYDNIWLIGDAAPNGWSLDDAAASSDSKMTKTSDYVLSWTGHLNAGELKFSCDLQRDWNGDWFMAASNGKLFSEVTDEVMTFVDLSLPENSGTDRKWKVESAGNYTITINQLTERMTVTKN